MSRPGLVATDVSSPVRAAAIMHWMTDESVSTIDPGVRARVKGETPHPVLTIAYHPDVSRIGERHHLAAARALEVSRLGPDFSLPDAAQARPLGDRGISRKPLRIAVIGDALRLDSTGTSTPVLVDGSLLTELRIGPERLARGVALELGERIVLWLHRMSGLGGAFERGGLIGRSEAMAQLREEIVRVASAEASVLIRGASGAGKELVAKSIHTQSERASGPFLAVNMAAVPPSTAVAELFGHQAGAFTGATHARPGLFARADGGTLFLDEVGAAPTELQAVLLRTLETGEVHPLGGGAAVPVDVRVVAATDEDLEGAVARGGFRLPLYHRLAGYELAVPPLRDRADDVMLLFVHFLRLALHDLGALQRLDDPGPSEPLWLPTSITSRLLRHPWPGNVRELRNAAQRVAIAGADHATLSEADLIAKLFAAAPVPRPVRPADGLSEERVIHALRAHQWEGSAAARALGIPKTTLHRFMDQSPRIRLAKTLTQEEILRAQAACQGDVSAMAELLEVSRRGLLSRMTTLDIDKETTAG